MNNAFLLKTEKIEMSKFQKIENENIFYFHFLVNEIYYLFIFRKEPIDLKFIYQFIEVLEILDSRERRIRSIRGLILYALEIMEKDEKFQVLETNLEPFFWKNIQRVIRQNQRSGLENYLFSNDSKSQIISSQNSSQLKFQNLKEISDEEKKEIIKKGLELQRKNLITLKDYYEGDCEGSLIQFKGYRVKYENIRRTRIYKEINTSNIL